MAYTKTNWVDNGAPAICAPNLNNLESQYDEVKSELQKTDGTSDIKPQAKNILIQDTNNNITATNVEDALQELAGNVQTGKNSIASAITSMGQSAASTDTFDTLSSKIRAISTDANAGVGDVLSGKTFYSGGNKQTGAMTNNGAVIITPGASNIAIPLGYHNGAGYVKGDANLVPANIKNGTTIFGVTGTLIRCFSAGSNLILASTTNSSTTNKTPTKVKEIKVNFAGSVQVTFHLGVGDGSGSSTGYGQIYVNGVQKGTLRSVSTSSGANFTENIYVNMNDLVQLYIYVQSNLPTVGVASNYFALSIAEDPNNAIVTLE